MSGAAFTAACIQHTAGPEPAANLRLVGDLIRRARDAGADFIMTAEASNLIASGKQTIEAVMNQAGRAVVELLLQLSATRIKLWLDARRYSVRTKPFGPITTTSPSDR